MKKLINRKRKEWDDLEALADKFGFTIQAHKESKAEYAKERVRSNTPAALARNIPAPCPQNDKYYQAGLRARRFADGIIEAFKPAFLVIAGLMVMAFVVAYLVVTLLVLAAVPWAGIALLIPIFLVGNLLMGR